jgi:hypothetical protein
MANIASPGLRSVNGRAAARAREFATGVPANGSVILQESGLLLGSPFPIGAAKQPFVCVEADKGRQAQEPLRGVLWGGPGRSAVENFWEDLVE